MKRIWLYMKQYYCTWKEHDCTWNNIIVHKKNMIVHEIILLCMKGTWLCIKRKDGGRGLKLLREVYEETRFCVGCYMFVSDNRWIKKAWKQETRKESISVKDEIMLTVQT